MAPGRRGHWLKLATAWLPVLTVAIGAGWGLFSYLDAREFEAQRPFLTKRLEVFFDTARVTGVLASVHPAKSEWKDARARLLALRWSELQLFGTDRIRARIRHVEDKLYEFEAAFGRDPLAEVNWEIGDRLRRRIECLADELRNSVELDWSGKKQAPSGTDRYIQIVAPCA